MSVRLVTKTPDAERQMAYVARVSNPDNQRNENYLGLLKYCIRNKHWSVFEHAFMTLEIETSRGIAAQILRHRSFTFQEFSQRYSDTSLLAEQIPVPEFRRQDTKNRQNSIDDIPDAEKIRLGKLVSDHFESAQKLYNELLSQGIAKECARFVLPLATPTRIYMTGNVRDWIHYIDLRSANGTQKEHREIALGCREIFIQEFPVCAEALEWK